MTISSPGQVKISFGNWVKLEGSEKCQRVLRYLLNHSEWCSTYEVDRGANVCAVHNWMWSLKNNGIDYEKKQERGNCYYKLTEAGRIEGEKRLAAISKNENVHE